MSNTDGMDTRHCVNCDAPLANTKHFCSSQCADSFRLSEDQELTESQQEELDFINAMCYGTLR